MLKIIDPPVPVTSAPAPIPPVAAPPVPPPRKRGALVKSFPFRDDYFENPVGKQGPLLFEHLPFYDNLLEKPRAARVT